MRLFMVFLAVVCLPTLLTAQKPKRRCNGTAPDSTAMLGGPVYRDCDVDEPAQLLGNQPLPAFDPSMGRVRSGCLHGDLEFIVDAQGNPELGTVHGRPGNDRDLEEAVMLTIKQLRYRPARLADQPVRQVVFYPVTVRVAVRVTTSSGAPVGLPSSGMQRC